MINITNSDIAYAEKILLPENHHFDNERLEFIRDFTSLDLQAVPGSGKTTALLAKLIILEKYLPLKDNRGILVISHTNTAVDEIKERIENYCPKLFSYPNFIGTIQSFVDIHLAIPCFTNLYKSKPYRIDNEIYNERIKKKLSTIWHFRYGLTAQDARKISYLSNLNESLFYNFRCGFDNDRNIILLNKINGEKLEIKKPRGRTRIENYTDYTQAEKTLIYNWLLDLKKDLLQNDGVLHFDDAYFLSNLYLKQYSPSKKILQFRFEYIFVDEMQDMDIHQYNLLELLFYNNNDSHSIIQRIGDINQAIFNGFSDSENVWEFRENLKYLQGSHRLNPKIASIVEKLALTPNLIEGRQINPDNTQIEINPLLIIYNNDSKENVLNVFASKIEELINNNSIPSSEFNKYKALAWRKEHPDPDKIGLKDYWLQYNEKSFKTKIDYQCLEEYLIHFDKEKQTFEAIRKNILNSFLRIFRLENIVDEDNRPYTKRKLINYLKNLDNNEYEDFKLNIYNWSFNIIKNDLTVCNNIREYIPILLGYFQKVIDLSNDFINSNGNDVIEQDEIENSSNKFTHNDIEIEVGTVHSAKGQTHTATLYLETFFQRGYGNYESERLRNQFLGVNVSTTLNTNITSKEKIKKSAKMTYVGFSRPTHLLSVAIHKDRFDSCLADIDRDIWDIIEI